MRVRGAPVTQAAPAEPAPPPNTPTCYAVDAEQTSPKWCAAFARGCGGSVVHDSTQRPGPIAMFGSSAIWGVLSTAQRERRDWYYGDHGYFGRGRYFRCTKNAYQHDGSGLAAPNRLRQLDIEIKPWRRFGDHVLVCPPDDGFADLMGFSATAWLAKALITLARSTDREIRVRERATNGVTLRQDLRDCWVLVTYVSNAAVEALIAGVPVICTDKCAALRMGHSNLSMVEYPVYPTDREQWARNLAAQQWTLSEMASGQCWEAVRQQ